MAPTYCARSLAARPCSGDNRQVPSGPTAASEPRAPPSAPVRRPRRRATRVVGSGPKLDPTEHAADHDCRDVRVDGDIGVQHISKGPARAQATGPKQQVSVVGAEQPAVGAYPGVEQAGRLQSRLQPRPVGVVEVVREVHEPPECGTVRAWGTGQRRWWRLGVALRFDGDPLVDQLLDPAVGALSRRDGDLRLGPQLRQPRIRSVPRHRGQRRQRVRGELVGKPHRGCRRLAGPVGQSGRQVVRVLRCLVLGAGQVGPGSFPACLGLRGPFLLGLGQPACGVEPAQGLTDHLRGGLTLTDRSMHLGEASTGFVQRGGNERRPFGSVEPHRVENR